MLHDHDTFFSCGTGMDGRRLDRSHHFAGAIRGIGCTDRVLYVGTYEGLVYAYRRAR